MKRALFGVMLGGLLGLFPVAFWGYRSWRLENAPVWGVDVSHHQGKIDWEKVGKAGASFAYIKASEGGDHLDRQWEANWRGAKKAGIKWGPYHYFTFCRPAKEQAEHFLARLPEGESMLPPAIDVEMGSNCKKPPKRAKLKKRLEAFVELVEEGLGVEVILYFDEPARASLLSQALSKRSMWERAVYSWPREPWTFWQHSDQAHVSGIEGPVDRDVFAGDEDAWKKFLLDRALEEVSGQ